MNKHLSIFRRISILVFVLITALCLFFMGVTYLSTTNFHQASTQLLNKDVAAHIAKFTSPYEADGINKQKADSVFQNAMVLSPSVEVYFLDTAGKVIAFHAPESDIKLWILPLQNIKDLIASGGTTYIKGPDPKDPGNPKIFSAAEVKGASKNLGYIYVILGSNKSLSALPYRSYFSSFLIQVFSMIILLTIVVSIVYLNRLQRHYNRVLDVLEKFQNGDLEARFNLRDRDELAPVTQAFNKMADLLVYNINRLTRSEQERKDFIANISHDLRSPLSVARGYSETLLLQSATLVNPHQQHEFVQLILTKIVQVEHMVKQLFELSKMESVEFTPAKEPFLFSEILQETLTTLGSEMSTKNIALTCINCNDNAWINADVSMMERVLQNLFVNAIKYTPAGGQITAELQHLSNVLTFTIRNSGKPMSASLVTWINSPAETTSQLNSRPERSGIGLLIVKKILALHTFSLQVQVETNQNIFTINMPVYVPANAKQNAISMA